MKWRRVNLANSHTNGHTNSDRGGPMRIPRNFSLFPFSVCETLRIAINNVLPKEIQAYPFLSMFYKKNTEVSQTFIYKIREEASTPGDFS
jgi:hypothetical protein